ncbi:MAG: hypothetical protein J6N15_01870 [Ruminiclostridium sp.]|nr:hypothetical protein [Ruminiclostridium sp.]
MTYLLKGKRRLDDPKRRRRFLVLFLAAEKKYTHRRFWVLFLAAEKKYTIFAKLSISREKDGRN